MLDLPQHHFRAIVADPPWHFERRSIKGGIADGYRADRSAERHYPTMDLDAIKALPVPQLAHRDGCHLFLWATAPCLPMALEVITAWGFKYSTIAFTWIKLKRSLDVRQLRTTSTLESDLHVGLGLTTRKNAEFVLLGRRGNCKRVAKDVREVVLSPVREHSRKPDEVYARVERYCIGPYAELFARQQRPGWTVWGDETTRYEGGEDHGRRGHKGAQCCVAHQLHYQPVGGDAPGGL